MSHTSRTVPNGIKDVDLIFKFQHGLSPVSKLAYTKGSPKHGQHNNGTWGQNGKKFAKIMNHRKNRRIDRNYIESCLNDENED